MQNIHTCKSRINSNTKPRTSKNSCSNKHLMDNSPAVSLLLLKTRVGSLARIQTILGCARVCT